MSDTRIEKKVTQDDVARAAGVTRSMVSYVLNDSNRSVAPETKQKNLDAIDELGYRPNKFAQGLTMGNDAIAGKRIGVVLCNVDVFIRPYYTDILAGILSCAHKNNYHVSFIRFFDDLKNPILFNELIHPEEISGLVLLSTDRCIHTENDRAIIERIKERLEKIVCIEWQCEGLASVNFDRQGAALKAVDHLFNKGYKNIAYIGEEDNRVAGFKESHIMHGVINVEKLYIDYAFDMNTGYNAVKKLHTLALQKKIAKLPDAIFCSSDEVAIGALRYLNATNISVPNDIAIVSVDNIEMSEYTNPPLTTINVPKRAMGEQAVEMIVNGSAIQNETALSVMLPITLVERQSS